MSRVSHEEVESEVDRIAGMRIAELRVLWRTKLRSEPPPAFGPDLLRRSLAQKAQEDALGGLSTAAKRLLNHLVAQHAKSPGGRIVVPRRIKPGAVLVRQWKGRTNRVMVQQDGFAFDGRSYSNLSEIARVITGTRWNGPRFFGLRPDASKPEGSGEARQAVPNGPARAPRRARPLLEVPHDR